MNHLLENPRSHQDLLYSNQIVLRIQNQVLDTSDVPGGVVNIISGNRDHLSRGLAEHQDVQAMWYFGSKEGSAAVEWASSGNLKRTWVNYGAERRCWSDLQEGAGEEFLYQATQCKSVWMPMGDIFAN
ncbi:UNVERIFIED_CONTAM: hypothetical protein K2H54_039076 [Gekko kuhli]